MYRVSIVIITGHLNIGCHIWRWFKQMVKLKTHWRVWSRRSETCGWFH